VITPDQERVLLEIGRWMSVNGEAIYGTRPWEAPGEGPTEGLGVTFRGPVPATPYTAEDIRFTTKPNVLYAIALEWPKDRQLKIKSLAAGSRLLEGRIAGIRLLGSKAGLKWKRGADALTIELPEQKPEGGAFVFRITQR
jgi:alpha-L-fucosidase